MTSRCSSCGIRQCRNQIYKPDYYAYNPKFMTIFTHKYRPVLGRVWVVIGFLGDLLSKPCFLSKPLPSQSSNGMPAYIDGAQFPTDVSLTRRYYVGFVAEAE